MRPWNSFTRSHALGLSSARSRLIRISLTYSPWQKWVNTVHSFSKFGVRPKELISKGLTPWKMSAQVSDPESSPSATGFLTRISQRFSKIT